MFGYLSWGHLLVVAVVALIVLGPDRLPKAAAEAGRLVRRLRTMAHGATADLRAELGPELADLDLASLHPRRLLERALAGEDDHPAGAPMPPPSAAGAGTVGAAAAAPATLAPDQPAPFDPEAT